MFHVALKHEHRTANRWRRGDAVLVCRVGGWANVGCFISPKHSGEALHAYELHKQQVSQAGRGFSGLGVVTPGALPQRVEEKELRERLVDCLERQLRGNGVKVGRSHTELHSLCWRFVVLERKGRKTCPPPLSLLQSATRTIFCLGSVQHRAKDLASSSCSCREIRFNCLQSRVFSFLFLKQYELINMSAHIEYLT